MARIPFPLLTLARPTAVPTGRRTTLVEARDRAYLVGDESADDAIDVVPLACAAGRTLAHDLFSGADLPRFPSSAMDGWAIERTAGPWTVGARILAGDVPSVAGLDPGEARPIATGAAVPPGTIAVIRREHGDVVRPGAAMLHLNTLAKPPTTGDHIRPRGEEALRGDPLLRGGSVLSAPRIALAAVAGYDELAVRRAPSVDLVLLGDEIRASGVPEAGAIRDAFGPSLPTILQAMGLVSGRMTYAADDPDATLHALTATDAPLIVTTGGSSDGPTDFVRSALTTLGGRLVIDGVAMRPGHPVMLATLPGGRLLLCLPGNPLAAMMCLASLGLPLVDGMLGRPQRPFGSETLAVDVSNLSGSTRLVACAGGTPVPWQGSGMLRGLAAADAVVIIKPGGAAAGETVATVELPW
ncbi:molybdopterin molybdotransferase MoeA [Microbacteriaceae bacterium VKM Ac-2855]|nr:molybdopterin molybdotransferase MoeA [Microbacteriaceae bacterium VKM Ac-2855]